MLVIVSTTGSPGTTGRGFRRHPTATATWRHRLTGVFLAVGLSIGTTQLGNEWVASTSPGHPRSCRPASRGGDVGAAPPGSAGPASRTRRRSTTRRFSARGRRCASSCYPQRARRRSAAAPRLPGGRRPGGRAPGHAATAASVAAAESAASVSAGRPTARRRDGSPTSAFAGLGRRTRAEQTLRWAIAADLSYAPAHYNLALMLRNQGRLDESDRELWPPSRSASASRMAVVNLALDYRERGNRKGERGVRRGPPPLPRLGPDLAPWACS
jgi:hypothetical protein